MEDGLVRRTFRAISCGGRSGTEDVQGYKLWRTFRAISCGGRSGTEDVQGYKLRRTVWDGGRSGL